MKTIAPPFRAVQEMASRGLSGRLTVYDPQNAGVAWQLYMGGDRLYYASSTLGQTDRLGYLLPHLRPDLSPPASFPEGFEYDSVRQWCTHLALSELRTLLTQLSQEALVHALSIPKADLEFQRNLQPDPILISPPWHDLAVAARPAIQQWQRLRPHISSPLARLYLEPRQIDALCHRWEQARAETPEGRFFQTQNLTTWIRIFGQRPSLYEAAGLLQTPPLNLAVQVQPLVEAGIFTVIPFSEQPPPLAEVTETTERAVIACVDDSRAVQRQVQMTLELAGYEVVPILEPTEALTTLVRRKPLLILMDINMPDIDGYELCRMLRQSRQLREVPIIMLTGRDGLIDRLRAQLVGATSYLTKPFEPTLLLTTVQKFTESLSAQP
ncbi:MAG: response regulator [Gloeomargaritaceae cyanobacterium C42_A2020_066]|nr:response regulator [Gloeomargaritaceae cyanobacterium C42_A2020_066]